MADGGTFGQALSARAPAGWRNRLISSRRFQDWAARFPLTRGLVRKDGAALFDLMAGFCHSQILMALAELKIPDALLGGAMEDAALAQGLGIPSERLDVLLQGGASIGLLTRKRGKVSLTRQGVAFASVPGLSAMVRHHRALYRDLEDPVAFFRGETTTELADVWPYVFGNTDAIDHGTAAIYSELMAQSQALVAADTLRMVSLKGVSTLLDIGGGTGAFLEAAGQSYPDLSLHLFDLPSVVPAATSRFEAAGMTGRATITPGSFRDNDLPQGAEAISLVRVLYDHSDDTVRALLQKVYDALPAGGRLLISEPMSGGAKPDKATDGYFALYTMAMRTGRTRSAARISELLTDAGFEGIKSMKPLRSYVTSVVTVVKPN